MALRKVRLPTLSRHCTHRGCTTARALSSSSIRQKRRGEDHYIQKSKIPTLHFQASLPRLPIPDLRDSCDRYLSAVQPLLSESEFLKTQHLAKEFSAEGSAGSELQQRLVERDKKNKDSSFIADFWYDMYLKDRRSVVLNHNPFLTFNDDPRNPSQADRAAQIISAAIRFRNSLSDGVLRPEVFHLNPEKSDKSWFNLLRFIPQSVSWYGAYMVNAFPLDMVQYRKLFGTTRLPNKERDELVTTSDSSHVIIMRNNHFYEMEVVQSDGSSLPINDIHAQLEAILQDSTPSPSHPLCLLPSLNRTDWAEARQLLISDSQNALQLDKISSALFVLSLDDTTPTEPQEAMSVFLHNYGFNRWVDKSLQFIVCANSSATVSFEHAWGDGVAVVRLANEIFDATINKPRPLTTPTSLPPTPKKLEFRISECVRDYIDLARNTLKEKADSLSVNVMLYDTFNKKYLKNKQLSPDAIMQLAFQLAYYRQYKTSPSTYESCSTAGFKHGRTETVRPASVATMNCAKGFEAGREGQGVTMNDKIKLIHDAVSWHSKLVREAATGKGFDRHLFALKCLAEADSLTLPFFEDPSYNKLNNIILSTSTLATPSVAFGGFGPVNDDSYGIGYRVNDQFLGANVATYPSRDGAEFVSNLILSLNEIYEVLESPEYTVQTNKKK